MRLWKLRTFFFSSLVCHGELPMAVSLNRSTSLSGPCTASLLLHQLGIFFSFYCWFEMNCHCEAYVPAQFRQRRSSLPDAASIKKGDPNGSPLCYHAALRLRMGTDRKSTRLNSSH